MQIRTAGSIIIWKIYLGIQEFRTEMADPEPLGKEMKEKISNIYYLSDSGYPIAFLPLFPRKQYITYPTTALTFYYYYIAPPKVV